MNRYFEPGISLTHKPTGESVKLSLGHRYRPGDISRAFVQAKRWLLSRLAYVPDGPPIKRSYNFSPDYYVGIRQDGEVLAKGIDEVVTFLDGRLPGQFGTKGEPS
jgi:hypothetical protein